MNYATDPLDLTCFQAYKDIHWAQKCMQQEPLLTNNAQNCAEATKIMKPCLSLGSLKAGHSEGRCLFWNPLVYPS